MVKIGMSKISNSKSWLMISDNQGYIFAKSRTLVPVAYAGPITEHAQMKKITIMRQKKKYQNHESFGCVHFCWVKYKKWPMAGEKTQINICLPEGFLQCELAKTMCFNSNILWFRMISGTRISGHLHISLPIVCNPPRFPQNLSTQINQHQPL